MISLSAIADPQKHIVGIATTYSVANQDFGSSGLPAFGTSLCGASAGGIIIRDDGERFDPGEYRKPSNCARSAECPHWRVTELPSRKGGLNAFREVQADRDHLVG